MRRTTACLALALLTGCGSLSQGPHLSRLSCAGKANVIRLEEGGSFNEQPDGSRSVVGPAEVCLGADSETLKALAPVLLRGGMAASGVPVGP